MPDLPDVTELAETMLSAAKQSLSKDWPKAKNFAKPEFSRLAQSLLDIGELAALNQISALEAQSLLAIHRNTTKTVLLTVEGLGLLAVEKAINAALSAVQETVNTAVGVVVI